MNTGRCRWVGEGVGEFGRGSFRLRSGATILDGLVTGWECDDDDRWGYDDFARGFAQGG